MTSFELFILSKLEKKSTFHIHFYTFFLLKYIICDKLRQFMKKIQIFCIRLWNNVSLLNYARKAVEKRKWAGLKNLICINFKCL